MGRSWMLDVRCEMSEVKRGRRTAKDAKSVKAERRNHGWTQMDTDSGSGIPGLGLGLAEDIRRCTQIDADGSDTGNWELETRGAAARRVRNCLQCPCDSRTLESWSP
jgi:hypothetical protein